MGDVERVLLRMIRRGFVSDADTDTRKVRVTFDELDGMTSGWLFVPRYPGVVASASTVQGHTHSFTDSIGGSGSTSTSGSHTHEITLTDWMPKINERVWVLYYPVDDGDGLVLGVV